MKLISLLIFLSCCFGCGNHESSTDLNTDKLGLDTTKNIYSVTGDDFSMNRAIEKARKTLEEFDKALQSNNPLYTDFAVKKRYITPDGGGEHMWIGRIILVNGNYRGYINNDAEKTTEVKYGDTVVVTKNEITDWMYLNHNILVGGYTIRDVRNKMSKEERISMDKELGFTIED